MNSDGRNVNKSSSALFEDPSADLAYTSCDGVTFRLSSSHVKVNATDLPLPDSHNRNNNSEAASIALEETSDVLVALFQFIQRPSNAVTGSTQRIVRTICSDEKYSGTWLLELIKAANKYAVDLAVDACLLRLEQLVNDENEIKKHPLQIANLADQYKYTDLLDKTAEVALSLPLDKYLLDTLTSPGLLHRFILYQSQWIQIKNEAMIVMKGAYCRRSSQVCPLYNVLVATYQSQVADDLRNVVKIPEIKSAVQCLNRDEHSVYRCQYEWSIVLENMPSQKASIKKLSEIVL